MNKLITSITVGFDFSDNAREAAKWAAAIAERSANATKVTLVTAYPGHMPREVRDDLEQLQASEEGAARELIRQRMRDDVAEHGFTDEDASYEVMDGVKSRWPFAALISAANSLNSDLLIVGATGMGRLQRFLVGSTAERLVRKSKTPVLVVAQNQLPVERILCPIDYSPVSLESLNWAVTMARLFEAELDVMHTVELAPGAEIDAPGRRHISTDLRTELNRKAMTEAEQQFADALEEFDFSGVSWHRVLRPGNPVHEILQRTEELSYGLVCMGSLGLDHLQGMVIGNTAERVLRSLPTSLLTVKPQEFEVDERFL
ncbi:MAG: universal stress protein [Myxococcales bacterium]|nr:universal stress protein [Myxococcales bacterium]